MNNTVSSLNLRHLTWHILFASWDVTRIGALKPIGGGYIGSMENRFLLVGSVRFITNTSKQVCIVHIVFDMKFDFRKIVERKLDNS